MFLSFHVNSSINCILILSFFLNSNVSAPIQGSRATNSSAEIQAATRAINDAGRMGYDNIRVNTDSDFVRKAATEWMPTWKENNWNKSNGQPVVNRQDFQNLDRAMRNNPKVNVQFHHVPGHSGNPGNEAADRLAKEGAKQYRGGY